jgi:signal transduction histidine kinase/CheY-like chemotaxis protein
MPGSAPSSVTAPVDRSRALLDFVHGRLLAPRADGPGLVELLADLARAGGAEAAGFATLAGDGTVEVRQRVPVSDRTVPPGRWPWEEQPDLLARLRAAPAGLPAGPCWLPAVVGQPGDGFGLLWLERPGGPAWSAAEGAALTLAGRALVQFTAAPLGLALKQQRLEDVAGVVRRLAHEFGNVLTTILGFTELGLNQAHPGSPLHGYLQEVHRGAEQGADLTARLGLFSRRGPAPQTATPLALVLGPEVERLRAAWAPAVRLEVTLPAALPPVRMDADLLRQVLLPVLENAREAIDGTGTVRVTAGLTELSPARCLDVLGSPRPGPFLELTVADTGAGLNPEVCGRLLGEPLVTTKPRHRGLGLAAVYGLMQLHRGGFRLGAGPADGTVARLYLPVAVAPHPGPPPRRGEGRGGGDAADSAGGRGEQVLVVDDDPLILKFVRTTLERAGYRVQAVGGGAEALAAFAASAEPYRLVLSDVLMPGMSGVDLAGCLLQQDAAVNLLFMSGHVSADFARENLGKWKFNLLQKPFRVDGLLRAVRTALDRGARQPPVAAGSELKETSL